MTAALGGGAAAFGDRDATGDADAAEPAAADASGTDPGAEDERWMRRALELAAEASAAGEVPVGAVLVRPDGRPAAEGRNRTVERADPTAHAELLALRRGGEALGDWRLLGHTLYATLEPCAMCAGALVLSRVARLVFAASDPKAGMCGSLGNIPQDPRLNHRLEVTGGVLADPAGELLRKFFRTRR